MYRYLSKKTFASGAKPNPFSGNSHKSLKVGTNSFNYFDINALGAPISILEYIKTF
jgi:hypothetical protein